MPICECSTRPKLESLKAEKIKSVIQDKQLENPDSRIILDRIAKGKLLNTTAKFGKGSTTGDKPRFLLAFWEVKHLRETNIKWLDSPSKGSLWSGRQYVTNVALNDSLLNLQLGCWLRGQDVWGNKGVAVSKMSSL